MALSLEGEAFLLSTSSPFAPFLVEQSRALSLGGVPSWCASAFKHGALSLLFTHHASCSPQEGS